MGSPNDNTYLSLYVDIDECAMGTDMCADRSIADCTNNFGSYECICKTGYTGDGFSCEGNFQ